MFFRKEKEGMFEYGSCSKAFPDEEIKILNKPEGPGDGNFFTNWYVIFWYTLN